jgi:hypothetical protein
MRITIPLSPITSAHGVSPSSKNMDNHFDSSKKLSTGYSKEQGLDSTDIVFQRFVQMAW